MKTNIKNSKLIESVESYDEYDEKTGKIVYKLRMNFNTSIGVLLSNELDNSSIHPPGKDGWDTAEERDKMASKFVEKLDKKLKEGKVP